MLGSSWTLTNHLEALRAAQVQKTPVWGCGVAGKIFTRRRARGCCWSCTWVQTGPTGPGSCSLAMAESDGPPSAAELARCLAYRWSAWPGLLAA